MKEGFSITPSQANVFIDKLYEILARKSNVKIKLIRKCEKNKKS